VYQKTSKFFRPVLMQNLGPLPKLFVFLCRDIRLFHQKDPVKIFKKTHLIFLSKMISKLSRKLFTKNPHKNLKLDQPTISNHFFLSNFYFLFFSF
jgi:hypothetical protein